MMVSRDGEEWTLLQSDFTTDTNPAGNNLGHGLTGDSGGWQKVDWDLGPWTGELVQLRVSMVTDSADTQPGLVIRDLGGGGDGLAAGSGTTPTHRAA